MIRNGHFCTYKGKEFQRTSDGDDNLIIFTSDAACAKEGFIDPYGFGVYKKAVKPYELEDCYRVRTKGKMHGHVVDVSYERENEYLVGTAYSDTAEKLGLDLTDKYYYENWVSKDDVEVYEIVEEDALD